MRKHVPEAETTIHIASLTLEEMRNLCRRVPDGHVMPQTIQPAGRYTGERNYDLKMDAWETRQLWREGDKVATGLGRGWLTVKVAHTCALDYLSG